MLAMGTSNLGVASSLDASADFTDLGKILSSRNLPKDPSIGQKVHLFDQFVPDAV
jgi:hypothetical protein